MAWLPISATVPQYVDSNGDPYSGAVLKAYTTGTTTNINFATDDTGGTEVSSIALNAAGNPEVSGSVVIPHIEEKFKLALYPTQAAADADSGAIWTVDAITPPDLTDTDTDVLVAVSSNDTTPGYLNGKLVAGTNVTLTEGSDGGNETLTIASQSTKGNDVASASALTLGTGNYFDITGTTGITSIDGVSVGTVVKLHFDDALTITHDATNLILPGGLDIVTTAGDEAEFVEYASGDWRMTNYQRGVAAVANHVRAGNMQIITGDDSTGSVFSISGSVTQSTWETIGPTAASADNTWAILDALPANARILICEVSGSLTNIDSTQPSMVLYVAEGNVSGQTADLDNYVYEWGVDHDSSITGYQVSTKTVFIPLASDNLDFQVYWVGDAGGGGALETMLMYYRGFITD